jgi:hypothetical protein
VASVIDAVRAGYQAGLCLLPVREDGTKAPDVPGWLGYQKTRPTRTEMREFWFANRCGYGALGGEASGYLDPWDFDCGATFLAFLEAAQRCDLGELVERIRQGYEDETPNGGRRWLVRYPADVEWQKVVLARRPGRPDEEKPVKVLIELTTFSILAPSNGRTHPSGQPYVRRAGGFDTIASYTREERDELFTLARSFDQMPRRAARETSTAMVSTGTRPGDDYNRRMTWAQVLEPMRGRSYLSATGNRTGAGRANCRAVRARRQITGGPTC